MKTKLRFCFALYSAFTALTIVEDRMRLNNENKTSFLFCIVLSFHYLCTQMIIYLTRFLKNIFANENMY